MAGFAPRGLKSLPGRRGWRQALAVATAGIGVIGAAAYGIEAWRSWERYVPTDDAFVEARIAPVSAKMRGTVIEVPGTKVSLLRAPQKRAA